MESASDLRWQSFGVLSFWPLIEGEQFLLEDAERLWLQIALAMMYPHHKGKEGNCKL